MLHVVVHTRLHFCNCILAYCRGSPDARRWLELLWHSTIYAITIPNRIRNHWSHFIFNNHVMKTNNIGFWKCIVSWIATMDKSLGMELSIRTIWIQAESCDSTSETLRESYSSRLEDRLTFSPARFCQISKIQHEIYLRYKWHYMVLEISHHAVSLHCWRFLTAMKPVYNSVWWIKMRSDDISYICCTPILGYVSIFCQPPATDQ